MMKYSPSFFAIVTICLLISTGVTAQHKAGYVNRPQYKIGFINMDELISAMPETRHARQILQASADSLSRIDANLQRQFTTSRDAFFQDSASMDSAKKEAQRRVLQKLLQQYNQFRADAKTQLDSTQQAVTAAV
ncbi:MAG TPA: OmpH family outer membrane protein, partial [Puia sp.]|nr:OmpH family outer membrane protein [Puia sp.]